MKKRFTAFLLCAFVLFGCTACSDGGTVAEVSDQRFALDGYYIGMKAYQIGGNNYVKLRDLALQINFGVDYDNESGRGTIYPGLFYGEEPSGGGSNQGAGTTVTEEMLRTWELQMVDRINEERRQNGKNYLLENADDATADLLENVRLGRMSLKGPEGSEQ